MPDSPERMPEDTVDCTAYRRSAGRVMFLGDRHEVLRLLAVQGATLPPAMLAGKPRRGS